MHDRTPFRNPSPQYRWTQIKLRRGSNFPAFLEPRRSSEKVQAAVVQEANVHGISMRSVDELVKA